MFSIVILPLMFVVLVLIRTHIYDLFAFSKPDESDLRKARDYERLKMPRERKRNHHPELISTSFTYIFPFESRLTIRMSDPLRTSLLRVILIHLSAKSTHSSAVKLH